ncbi:conserved hypothetical protein [uncultured Eubacteriales bacterium]|uniref:NTPase n=1 Tax=uncultured Eubacteriales bacterium TaxID=172733 RepID=A0A212KF87_9FIRM|nr:conserved hypothetical protein [uncultured Eubacteriales bacterium]
MHLFLTGPVGCGKSTVIQKTVALGGLRVGGFRTGFGPDRREAVHSLYLWNAWEKTVLDEEHTVARFGPGGVISLPKRFDALGCAALDCPGAELILMDECGRLEREARRFHAAVLRTLGGNTSVLGVVRQGFPGWTRAIAEHPRVELIEVTEENRNALPEELLHKLEKHDPPSP